FSGGWSRRPDVGTEVMVVAAGGEEQCPGITPDGLIETESGVIKLFRLLEVTHVQMEVADHGVVRSPVPGAIAAGPDQTFNVQWISCHDQLVLSYFPVLTRSIRVYYDS